MKRRNSLSIYTSLGLIIFALTLIFTRFLLPNLPTPFHVLSGLGYGITIALHILGVLDYHGKLLSFKKTKMRFFSKIFG